MVMGWLRGLRKQRVDAAPPPVLVQGAKGRSGPCRCDPQWPGLETEANGYTMPAVQSDAWSPVTAGLLGDLEARCTQCHATHTGPWLLAPGTPPPFAWAREEEPGGQSAR
jgi:hypothetical protein